MLTRIPALALAIALFALAASKPPAPDPSWPAYGHDPGGTKFSPLDSINTANVSRLKPAWTFHTGDMYDPNGKGGRKSAFESTPLFIDGALYVTTALGRILALNPETGQQLWAFDTHANYKAGFGDLANRGASAWRDPATHRLRLFIATIDAHLFAVDASTGKAVDSFGRGGSIDLHRGLRIAPHNAAEYEETSPPAIAGNLVIVGSGIADNNYADAASGEVRAFDARTGRLVWTFDPLPGSKTGAANTWSIISVDPQRKLVFLPTTSASPDYYGGLRPGDDRDADSLIALHADTGKVAWRFQTVHHDLWDYDIPSQPVLFTLRRNGQEIPAIAVGSKTGNLFLLNRETGEPIFGVEERPVPQSDVPGEKTSPTQPFPILPKPVTPQSLTAADIWGPTPEDRKWCQDLFAGKRAEGIFTPPSVQGSIIFPGNIGGMAWGGAAFDPHRGLLVLPTNRLAALVFLIPRDKFDAEAGKMPGFEYSRQRGTPYGMARTFIRSPKGLPCNAPPWGTLTAIDVSTGLVKWEVPFGSIPWLASMPGADRLGSPSLGGPIVTGGGLVFIGAAFDAWLRAFDTATGAELWKGALPAGARATPMTYSAGGKQYVVIAAGGFDIPGSSQTDTVVAFALPETP